MTAVGADQALRSLTSLAGGVATFGLLRNANYYFLSELLETFHNRYPEVRLRIIGLNSVEVLFASADPAKTAAPATIELLAASDLVLYDAHYGWRDPTRRQLAERAQLAGVTLTPRIELEHVETALGIVALGGGDTIVSRAVAESRGFPEGVHTVGFQDPLYDTIAIVQRHGTVLSPATREISRLAKRMLLER